MRLHNRTYRACIHASPPVVDDIYELVRKEFLLPFSDVFKGQRFINIQTTKKDVLFAIISEVEKMKIDDISYYL